MRFTQLSASATAIVLMLAAPACAQEAGDCDMICRLKGYLSTDHMAGDAAGDAPGGAPAKARRPHAAAVHKPSATPKPVVASLPRPGVARTAPEAPTVGKVALPADRRVAGARPAPVRAAAVVVPPAVPARAAKSTSAKAAPAKFAPAETAPARMAAAPAPTRAVRVVPVAAEATPAGSEPPRVRAAAAPHRSPRLSVASASAATRTASLATAIPGSAPAMQAGFH